MPYVELSITIPDLVWMSDLSQAFPETTFRVTAATANEDVGVARIDLLGGDASAVCEAGREYDAVTELTVLDEGARTTRIQIETTAPVLLRSIQESGVPLQMPFDVQDGELTLELTVPSDTLSEFAAMLDDYGIAYSIDRVQQQPESERKGLLTERQERVLDRAVELGYYDTPRRTTLVELADDLDIAKSTCSELLHRVEEQLVKNYRDDSGDATDESVALSD